MERKVPQSVGDVLRNLLEESSLQGRMEELRAVELWPSVVGREIALQCRKPFVKGGVMSVGVANAALRNELHMNRTRLRLHINELIGKDTITEIKFIS